MYEFLWLELDTGEIIHVRESFILFDFGRFQLFLSIDSTNFTIFSFVRVIKFKWNGGSGIDRCVIRHLDYHGKKLGCIDYN